MNTQTLNGDFAFAHGALEAGVRVVSSYPGSPSSGTVKAVLDLTDKDDVHVEWSTNEKVAFEVGIGASLAGRRSLVCVKSVGMNVLVDPLMTINLCGVNGGLVILLGDDPGAYGSQNDQDTRSIALYSELPLLEPSTPSEAKSLMVEAFEFSERFGTAVIVRLTRSFSQQEEVVELAGRRKAPALGLKREPYRWLTFPGNAVEMHARLHDKTATLKSWADESSRNRVTGAGRRGIIAAGFSAAKLRDVIGDSQPNLQVLELVTLFPLPENRIAEFVRSCEEVLVVEENTPFVELQTRALLQSTEISVPLHGKRDGYLPAQGELFRWQIQNALQQFLPDFTPAHSYLAENESDERPVRHDHCAGCPFPEVIDILQRVAGELGQDPLLVGDPGCLVKAADRLYTKHAIGSAIAVAQGLVHAEAPERAIALLGDSAFYHTSIPALLNAVIQRTPILMVILDNSGAVTTGSQPTPQNGRDSRGESSPVVRIEDVARACGVRKIRSVSQEDGNEILEEVFREALVWDEPGLVVVERLCD